MVTVIFRRRKQGVSYGSCRGIGYTCFCAMVTFPDTLNGILEKVLSCTLFMEFQRAIAFSYSKARILFGDARKEETASEEKEGSREHSAWLRATGNGFPCFMS